MGNGYVRFLPLHDWNSSYRFLLSRNKGSMFPNMLLDLAFFYFFFKKIDLDFDLDSRIFFAFSKKTES